MVKVTATTPCDSQWCGHLKLEHDYGHRCQIAGCNCPRFIAPEGPRRVPAPRHDRRPRPNDVRLFDPER